MLKSERGRRRRLRVGFAFNIKRPQAPGTPGKGDDSEAEFDSPATLQAIREAIASFGHRVIDFEANEKLPALLAASRVDVVFNVAEGKQGRSRESQVPALLELLGIPYTGSDAATLAVTLDKAVAKVVVAAAGVATPPFQLLRTGEEPLARHLGPYPRVVKPAAEGSSKGVNAKSVANNARELRSLAKAIIGRYRQPALVESYLGGREFSLAILEMPSPTLLPILEIIFTEQHGADPIYTFEDKCAPNPRIRYQVPARIPIRLATALRRAALTTFQALGCRDVARMDFRLDAHGRLQFLECNPLPGLTPEWSDLVMISQAAGLRYRDLVGAILDGAIRRLGA